MDGTGAARDLRRVDHGPQTRARRRWPVRSDGRWRAGLFAQGGRSFPRDEGASRSHREAAGVGVRRPVETYKRKFDGSTKGAWHGELLEESPDGWLVVFYAQPPHEVA